MEYVCEIILKLDTTSSGGDTVKPVLSGHSKRKPNYRLLQVKSIADCSRSILQYFRPSLSYHMSLIYLFCLFVSGGLRLFYCIIKIFLFILSSNGFFIQRS